MKNVLIIAEAGVNHNGDLETAIRMIDKAKEAGADIVKFQTGIAKNVISKYACKAQYQLETTKQNETQLTMVEKIMLPFESFTVLKKYCDKINIRFLSTPFDIESIKFLNDIVDVWKIPSGEITNLPYLMEIGKSQKPVIMSTGMSNMDEIRRAIHILRKQGSEDISLLHCNTQYPTPYEDVNLKALEVMRNELGLPVGYSDHTKGIEVPIAAVALGATIIEKHFTLDRNMEGPDHKASLEPDELKTMISAIRHIECALGDGVKKVTESESVNLDIARKSIVAKKYIQKGEVLTVDNITTKRPGNGLSPMKWFEVLGTRAICDFEEDELIVID